MWYGHDMWSGGWMIVGMIVFWGVWGLIGWGVLRTLFSTTHSNTSITPLEIAQTRYAQGEISKEEYETIVQTLDPPPV